MESGKTFSRFKDGDTNDPSNYILISILPVLSKVFEKHLNQQVQEYLTTSGLFHKLQCGCRQGYSCIDSVHYLISNCLSAKLKGSFVSLMFLDFKKAFDCVNHGWANFSDIRPHFRIVYCLRPQLKLASPVLYMDVVV